MNLYINGCSFSFGSVPTYDDGPNGTKILTKPWPGVYHYHLEPHFDLTVNQSFASGSNDRIVRKTLDFFHGRNDKSNWTAVIQWTAHLRGEVHPESDKKYAGAILNPTYDDRNQEIGPAFMHRYRFITYDSTQISDYSQLEQRYSLNKLFNESEEIVRLRAYQNMLLLQEYFKNNNINYVFIALNDSAHPFPAVLRKGMWLADYPRSKSSGDIINTDTDSSNIRRFMLDQEAWVPKSMTSIIQQDIIGQLPDGSFDSHPNDVGHQRIADHILDHMKTRGILT